MIDRLKDLWARLTVHWHVLAVAYVAALPDILDWLGVVDLKPILEKVLPDGVSDHVVTLLPFAMIFLKPMFAVKPKEEEDDAE